MKKNCRIYKITLNFFTAKEFQYLYHTKMFEFNIENFLNILLTEIFRISECPDN